MNRILEAGVNRGGPESRILLKACGYSVSGHNKLDIFENRDDLVTNRELVPNRGKPSLWYMYSS